MLVVLRVALGGLMLVAGGAKLARRDWAAEAAGLGVPRRLASVVPLIEVGLGAWLVVTDRPRLAAIGVAGLLVAFTALLAAHLVRGQRPICACFGGRRSRPIGWHSIARNLALFATAAVVAVAG